MILAIYGAGGQGSIVFDVATKQNNLEKCWDDIIFIDDWNNEGVAFGHKRLHLKRLLKEQSLEEISFNVALGEPRDKQRVFKELINSGLTPANVISPDVQIGSDVQLGNGLFLNTGAIIHPSTTIGNNVTLMERSTVGHHCSVSDHCFITAGVIIGGNNQIGEGTFVGLHAITREKTTVGSNAVIGMGAVVVKNVPDSSVVVGNPAIPLRSAADKPVFNH